MAAPQRHRPVGVWRGLFGLALALPLLASVTTTRAFAQVGSARYSSIVVDAASGRVLQSDHPDALRHPASLAKLMTLFMTFEAVRDHRFRLDTRVPVSAHCASMEPTKLGLVPGSRIDVRQAILGLVTKSANDAACALGELLGGSESRYAQMATLRARALGMNRTTFTNASGLPDPDEWTSAHDIALLSRRILIDFPEDYHYFATPSFVYAGRTIFNHDTMLKSYPGADGMKTGYTNAAGHNLVTSAVRGGIRLIGVVLGAGSNGERDHDMTMALNESFQDAHVAVAGGIEVIAAAHAATVEHGKKLVRVREAEPVRTLKVAARETATPVSGWTIQVGSFSNSHAARVAAFRAQHKARRGDAHVEKIRLRHRVWWRAQVTGLTEAKAQQACYRLAHHHKAHCIVLRPEHPVVASK